MFSNSLKMMKIDWNLLELWRIVCKKFNFNISAFVEHIYLLHSHAVLCMTVINKYM